MKQVRRLLVVGILIPSAASGQEQIDPDIVAKIREEGFQRSQVMEVAWYLTDVLGPKVTGSDGMRQAQEWVLEHMRGTGLYAHAETIGKVGPSWDNEYTSIHMTAPRYQPLIGYPLAFTRGTDGRVRADVKIVSIESAEEFDRYRGGLGGSVVLTSPPVPLAPNFVPDARRFTDEDLRRLAETTISARYARGETEFAWDSVGMLFRPVDSEPLTAGFAPALQRFLVEEGVAGVLTPGPGRDGTVRVDGRPGSRFDRSVASIMGAPPMVALAAEHYNQLYRLVDRGIPTEVEIEIRNRVGAYAVEGHNLIGELPGSDLRDQVVMVGAHLDSWHAGAGAVDDAAGVAVVLEAIRILREIDASPRRTIRAAFFTYEEGGKVGSRAYIDQTYLTIDGKPTPEHAQLSAYFNMDNGSGRFRGLYLQGNERVRPIFEAWMAPLADLGMNTLTINNAFGLDIVGFDMAGLPAFQFIQDPLDYSARPYHSNMDVYDRLVPDDLRVNAVILACFLYQAATRAHLLPREAW